MMLRYRSLGSKDWKKHQFVYPTVVSETPVEVEIPGEPCQIYEIQLRQKKLELKLPDFQFGPENSVKNVEIQGPIYPVDRKHEFPKDVPKHEGTHGKDDLKYPVLGIEGAHHFQERPSAHVELAKELHGPMYDVEHGHK